MRSFFFIASLFVAAGQLVGAAQPPACLLAALEKQTNPTDYKTVCSGIAFNENLTSVCSGDSLALAYSAYSSTCSAKGLTVAALPTTTGSSTASPSSTSSGSSTSGSGSGGSGSGSGSGSGVQSGSGSGSTSANAGAIGMTPQPLVFAAAGLLATTLTSVIFL